MISINQLEAFVCVVKEGSISRAAEKLYLSQPTISTHISALESELHTKLFRRTSRGVSLTESGERFYPRSRDILTRISAAVSEVDGLEREIHGILSIAASTAPAEYVLPTMLADFRKVHPGIRASVRRCESAAVVGKVGALECDVGIADAAYLSASCDSMPLFDDSLVLIAPMTEHYSALQENFVPQMLQELPFVGRCQGSGTRQLYEEYFEQNKIDIARMNITCEMDSTEGVKRAVDNGMGVSLVSSLAVQNERVAQDFLVIEPKTELLKRQFCLIWRKTTHIPVAAELFLSYARSIHTETVKTVR